MSANFEIYFKSAHPLIRIKNKHPIGTVSIVNKYDIRYKMLHKTMPIAQNHLPSLHFGLIEDKILQRLGVAAIKPHAPSGFDKFVF